MNQDFNVKITKKELLKEISNGMCHNFYYLIYGKIYNQDNTRYRKFKFVECFDIFDLQEYFEKDCITKNDIKEYANEIAFSNIGYIKNYNDTRDFYNFCNESIKNYNESNRDSYYCIW